MILGTSSGSGKSLISTAFCRALKHRGFNPIPFKGQNMSNNAWVDYEGKEMAYSQAVQAWAAEIEPMHAMNPILLKPKGDCISEVIHLGKSVGTTSAKNYYQNWFNPGWEAIKKGLKKIEQTYKDGRLVIEGAGSPVEINLQHKDLTNLRLAKYLDADCILVSDIERGGVFAQIVGTLELLNPNEKKLIKGIIINKFRGDISLFDEGVSWLENKTNIPILGVMPWLNEIFSSEDSLDLIERKGIKPYAEIEITVIRLPSISNFSDLEPLEIEPTIKINWIAPGEPIGSPDCIIIPGSKQSIRDLEVLKMSGMAKQIIDYVRCGGNIFGICGGLQMLGLNINDPMHLEHTNKSVSKQDGLNLLPIVTTIESRKSLRRRQVKSLWPQETNILGFELHHGKSILLKDSEEKVNAIFNDPSLGWIIFPTNGSSIGGTYLHGIFDNGKWRRIWINQLRKQKGLKQLSNDAPNYKVQRDKTMNLLSVALEKNINLEKLPSI